MDDIGGVWRTVGGRRIFIKDGQDLATAMKESGKFPNKKMKNNKIEKLSEEELIKKVSSKFTEDKVKEIEKDTSKSNYKNINDELLVEMAKCKGFDDNPTKLSTEEFEKYIKDNKSVVLYRGAPEETLLQLKDGDYYGGTGVYGSGYYFSEGERGKLETKNKYAKNNGSYIRATFDKKNMKIINFEEENLNFKANDKRFDYGLNSKEASIINNAGRYALANDYDAIYVENRNYYIILNRSKLIVENRIGYSNELELER